MKEYITLKELREKNKDTIVENSDITVSDNNYSASSEEIENIAKKLGNNEVVSLKELKIYKRFLNDSVNNTTKKIKK